MDQRQPPGRMLLYWDYDTQRGAEQSRLGPQTWGPLERPNTARILELLAEFQVRATFACVGYAAVSRVEFEIGTGAAIPTQLVLVPMLFVLPLRFVPPMCRRSPRAANAQGSVSRTPDHERVLCAAAELVARHRSGARIRRRARCSTTVGRVAGRGWCACGSVRFRLRDVDRPRVARLRNAAVVAAGLMGWVYLVDCALTPIAFALAFVNVLHPWALAVVFPLVALFRPFRPRAALANRSCP